MNIDVIYTCYGFTGKGNNEHLSGVVGDTHSLKRWLDIIYPGKHEVVVGFFTGFTNKEVLHYILENMGIRLKKGAP